MNDGRATDLAEHLPVGADDRVADILQTGRLRAAIGLTPIAITKDPVTGEMAGVALDLGHALAAAIGVELEPVIYPRPGAVIDGLQAGQWDVAISLGIDPDRASLVDFSPPYMEVDLTYLVLGASAFFHAPDADRNSIRIAVPRGDLVDILLSWQLQHAALVRADTVIGAFELLQAGHADVAALPRPNLIQWSAKLPGSRVLPDRFGANLVGMAVPKGRAGRLAYIAEFVEAAKASGLVREAIERAGLRGARLATVWRFRSPHHSCSESEMRTSEPKPH
jgi:polar amino acid transport system substrate-binding protein